jgi:hypothetical protein
MSRKATQYEMTFEVERNGETVEYVAVYTVSPAESDHYDRSIGGPGGWTPGCSAGVEDVSVFFARWVPCAKHRFKPTLAKRESCRECKTVRDPRPELDGLVSEEELLDHATECAEADYVDAAEARAEARREDRLLGVRD